MPSPVSAGFLSAQAVYTTLREAEYRSLTFVPYWRVPPLAAMVPRQRACTEALQLINTSLTDLIEKSRKIVRAKKYE